MAQHAAWLFGYGSLIWKPPHGLAAGELVFIRGWSRRFWQGSPDHRGTLAAPGRVVTLVPDEGAVCWGVAYSLGAVDVDALLASLDVREAGGYTRTDLEVHAEDPSQGPRRAITYIGTDTNSSFLGPASTREIAEHVCRSSGPSGHNIDYVLRLAESLRQLGAIDEHVFAIETHVRQLETRSV